MENAPTQQDNPQTQGSDEEVYDAADKVLTIIKHGAAALTKIGFGSIAAIGEGYHKAREELSARSGKTE